MPEWLTKLRRFVGASTKPTSSTTGDFIYELPYQAGRRFPVIQGYGGTYSHTEESHFSIDFGMPENTAICAARCGVVYRAVDHFTDGGTHPSFKPKANAIYVLHDDETIAAYVHLSRSGLCVRAGDTVAIGQTIGYSGNTGWSGTPHLHFHVADAFDRRRIPTRFRTYWSDAAFVEVNRSYKRPRPNGETKNQLVITHRPLSRQLDNNYRDAFAFFPDLLELSRSLVPELSNAGYEMMSDYSSVDAMHDVYGIEVCGINDPDVALQITRLLLAKFPGWNAGWLHRPDSSSSQGWVARVQRDRDQVVEYWDTD
jgi:hypothetical protein